MYPVQAPKCAFSNFFYIPTTFKQCAVVAEITISCKFTGIAVSVMSSVQHVRSPKTAETVLFAGFAVLWTSVVVVNR